MHELDWESLVEELIVQLRHLIRIDTSNPPGNEIEAARYLAGIFESEGIDYEILEPLQGRGSIVARLKGDSSRRPLLLMSHLDVVPAEAERWDHPPFQAEMVDGWIWGRGSLDCKCTVALWLLAMLVLKHNHVDLKRDVIFLAAADEEAGGKHGLGWIVDNRYDLIDAEVALNEGGGIGIELFGKTFYTYQNAEKGNLWLRLTAHGEPGHGSVPRDDNAVESIIRGIGRLKEMQSRPRLIETTRALLTAIGESQPLWLSLGMRLVKNPRIAGWLIPRAIQDEKQVAMMGALLRNTVCPTVLRAGSKVNTIPSEASAEVDIRILPGTAPDDLLQEVKELLGPGFDVHVLEIKPATESPVRHDLVDSIRGAFQQFAPDSPVVPILLPAVTDGAYLRPKGMAVYGFTPMLPQEPIEDIHGHNERISIESLDFMAKVGLNAILNAVS